MSHVETRYNAILHKIAVVQENHNNKYRHPNDILIILYKLIDELEPQVLFMKSKII
jgi:hypothetical protein